MHEILLSDREMIERKYHSPEEYAEYCSKKDYGVVDRMRYHGRGYIEESGIDDEKLLNGLEKISIENEHLPHPIARAKAIKYVLENERLYINEHDYFVGLYSLSRLADKTTFSKWESESRKLRNPELVAIADDFNKCGAVMIWTDYDHVVPDWESLMELGFSGIRERARRYREHHKQNGTLTEEMSAFFEGIEIQYTAIIDLLDRMYRTALGLTFEKAPQIAVCLKNLRDGKPTNFYEALQLIYIYFIISESIDSYQVRSLGNGLDNTLYKFYKNDIATSKYTKYGNNDELADKYAEAMSNYFTNKVNNVPNSRGGVYKAIMHSARAFIIQGKKTGALPDGRKAGEELSKNATPVVGMDRNGVTSLIKSAVKLSPSDYHESYCVDVMLHPSTVEGEDGLVVLKSLLMTYLEKGGQSLQFNIFNARMLRDAQKNPEKYQNLQVRVCGWNILWNNMDKKEQDAYILRAESIQ